MWKCRSLIGLTLGGLLLVATAPGAEAAPGGTKVSKARTDVDDVGGSYIQPEPVWVPVLPKSGRGRPIFLGLTLRLHPVSERRFEACILAPHVTDWVIVDFNRQPPERPDFDDLDKIRHRITELITASAGRGIFRQIEVMQEHRPVDEASFNLTEMCK
ncbi:MAG: hypothetical protein WCZ23_12240 [Rhodospirillaceae bacterium]